MSSGSPHRRWRRAKMRKNGVSFTDRVKEAMELKSPVRNVVFESDQPKGKERP